MEGIGGGIDTSHGESSEKEPFAYWCSECRARGHGSRKRARYWAIRSLELAAGAGLLSMRLSTRRSPHDH
ncbi:hypothetical protein AZ22_1556 [Bordetella bronchiseptica 980-2]|uniref:Uncharacterized protein n=1 Tax=Bordetella bronchiseptica 00-P-2796 TaxID=1331199 RepID=A0ABR4R8N5_BORBO|nr:hypothetical protein AZ22_1556 [Bordetella bronchiseptica 980-2]KCV31077.1 hypothetical protein L490_1403 [Bordetella bronchiseptica 00-P-2796]KCV49543.1 hypothetical protein L491_1654 [Bordetella bronchiseptica 3E44]KCV63221.1 hypothetical protein AZ14_1645 [Bordetella bronchiseptica 980]KDB61766.1 hypothetical protein AZ16_1668 [Bordetella bronchiseptica B18-5 (C3)]KDB64799.1 hypothetical protein AZ15_1635 [Bordetella bronchiseptica A1-7]KDB71151.1 hypothetical protein AZ21_1614 [Bordete